MAVLETLDLTFNVSLLRLLRINDIQVPVINILCLFLSAFSLSVILAGANKKRKIISRISAIIIIFIALLTISKCSLAYNWGEASIFSHVSYLNFLDSLFGRMSLLTAVTFLVIGSIILLLSIGKKATTSIAHALTFLIALESYLALASFILEAYSINQFFGIPLDINTCITFFFISVAIFTCQTDSWIMEVFVSYKIGSIMARRLLPGIIGVPILIGWLRINGERIGLFNSEVGVVLVATTYVVCFLALTWQNARSVNRIDEKRSRADESLRDAAQRLKYHFENSPLAVIEWNSDFIITKWSGKAEQIFGWSSEEVVGKNLKSLGILNEDDIPILTKSMEQLSSGKENTGISLNRNCTKLGKVIETTWYTSILFSESGKVDSVMTLIEDVTERKKFEIALRRSEEQYRTLAEISPYTILINRNNQITYVNQAGINLFGASSSDQILGKNPIELFHSEVHPIIKDGIEKVIKGIPLPIIELKIVKLDGTLKEVEATGSKFTDKEGKGIQVILNDISESKQAQKIKERYHLITKFAQDPLLLVSLSGEILEANNAAADLYNYSHEELLKLKIHDLRKENTNLVNTQLNIARQKGILFETLHRSKDGTIIPVEVSSRGVFLDGKELILSIVRNITDRKIVEKAKKELDEKLNLALENGGIGVWVLNVKTNVMEWDERMEKIFGFKPGTFDKTYNSFESCLLEDDIPHVQRTLKRAIDNDVPFESIFRIKLEDGLIKYINTKAIVNKDIDDETIKITGVCFDITEMKKGTEQTLFKLNDDLLRSNKELEQFAYVASHDLQEPLRMVSSFTQLLAQRYGDKLDQDAKEFIQFAVDGASRMQILINDLLAFSRIQTKGKVFSKVNMHDVIGKVIYNLSFKIQEKGALITNDALPEIYGDEGQMVQLLQNLISNAIKFSQNSPTVHISTEEFDDHFTFSVKDNGIGIEKQYFDRIFLIFQRLFPKDEYEGTGIGLAICKRIIERHGGQIWVESEIGNGTTFYFTIQKVKGS